MTMGWMDREDDEPEQTRSLNARMWSTSDRRPRCGSLNVTNSLRMYRTSDGTGGNMRVTPTRIRPSATDPLDAMRERLRRLRSPEGDGEDRNVRTNRWTAPWKAAPLPGTVSEARQRAQETRRANRFRPGTTRITDQVARRRGGFQSTGGKATGGFKRLTAIQNGKRGGRPRTAPRPVTRVSDMATDQVRNRGRFTSGTARQAGSRSTAKKAQAARQNAKRPRKPTVG